MATATVEPTQAPHPVSHPAPQKAQPVPIKVGVFGGQGSGKTTSTALMALALSKEIYGGAPVAVTDTEPGWQFLRPMFAAEGVELIQTTVPTFKAMLKDLRDAEKRGCCVWAVDSLTIIWNEILRAAKGNRSFIPISQWGDIKAVWAEYTNAFLNSSMCTFALGRLGNMMEEIQDEQTGENKLTKTGTQFKAGGSESFGYEPHLLLEMSLERKAKTKAGSRLEGEGRMVHRVDVLKDRTWALNGKVIRWSDKPRYEKGGYRNVWNSVKPHYDLVQQTMARVLINTESNSNDLFDANHDSDWAQKQRRKTMLLGELKETFFLHWPGQSADVKKIRLLACECILGVRSWEAVEQAPLNQLEVAMATLQRFERKVKAGETASTEQGVINLLMNCKQEIEQEAAAEADLPF